MGAAPEDTESTIRIYVARPPEGVPIRGGCVVYFDIFGFGSGRTDHFCDDLAARGYVAICPDFFGRNLNGVSDFTDVLWPPWKIFTGAGSIFWRRMHYPYPVIEKKLLDVALPFLRDKIGPDAPVGAVGFCWGAAAMVWSAARNPAPYKACVGVHPSMHVLARQQCGPSIKEVLLAVNCPLLFMPCRGDPAAIREGGELWNIVLANSAARGSKNVPVTTQWHGFGTRADIRVPANKKDVDDMTELTIRFFDEVMLGITTEVVCR